MEERAGGAMVGPGGALMAGRKYVLVANTSKASMVQALERRPDIVLGVVTEKRFAGLYRDDTVKAYVDDVADLVAARRAAERIAPAGGFDRVVALSERALPTAAYLRSFFGLPGIDFDTANRFTNKLAMKTRLAQAGIPVAPFALATEPKHIADAGDRVGWPVIVKPLLGSGVDCTYVVRERGELGDERVARQWRPMCCPTSPSQKTFPVIVEHLLDVEAELHCDTIVSGGEIRFVAVSKYFQPALRYHERIWGSHTVDERSPRAAAVHARNEAVIRAFGLADGVTHLEVLDTPEGLVVGEIACRPAGAGIPQLIELQYGVDIWDAYMRTELGEELDVAVERRPGTVLQCMLPSRLGRIERVTPPERFLRGPGAVRVEMLAGPGDVVSGIIDSCAVTGYVFLCAGDDDDMEAMIDEVDAAYELVMADE